MTPLSFFGEHSNIFSLHIVEHTNIVSIQKSPQQDHLKRLGHATEEHEESSDDSHNIVEQEGFFPAKGKETPNICTSVPLVDATSAF